MRKVLIVANYTNLPGESGFNRLTYIANKLAQRGNDVRLVTSNFNHQMKTFRNLEQMSALLRSCPYKVTFIEEPGYKENVSFDRIKSILFIEKKLQIFFNNISEKPDVIYCAYPPIRAAYIAGMYAKKNKIPFILDIQDIWPESFKGVIKLPEKVFNLMIFPLRQLAQKTCALADCIIGVSQTYVDFAAKFNEGTKLFLPIFIGTDLEYFDQFYSKSVKKPESEFWVVYIGTLGHSYDIKTAIKAVSVLKDKGYKGIRLKVIGDGPLADKFRSYAVKLNAPVDFLGYIRYEEMIPFLVKSDVALHCIVKEAQQSITNK